LNKIDLDTKSVKTKDELLQWVKEDFVKNYNKEFGEVLITAGAGDIDKMVQPIKEIIEKEIG